MGKLPHTACWKGKRVRVKLKTGELFEDVFENRTPNKTVFLKNYGKVRAGDIDSFGIVREKIKDSGPAEPRNLHPMTLKEVRKKHRSRLLQIDGVEGVGEKDGTICIFITKSVMKLPELLDGYPVIFKRV